MKYQTIRLIHIVGLSLAATVLTTNVYAQSLDGAVAHVGIGAGVTFYNPTNDDGQNSRGINVAWRWHSFDSGWGPTVGFDWHTTDYNQTLGGLNAPLGSLRMRAFLAGLGHTNMFGRFSVSENLTGGYSFNSFSVAGSAVPTFASSGVSLVGSDVDNSWVVRPTVAAWYDVFDHVGIGLGAAYMVSRPNQTITTSTGTVEQHLKADAFELTAGVTFGLWKKKP